MSVSHTTSIDTYGGFSGFSGARVSGSPFTGLCYCSQYQQSNATTIGIEWPGFCNATADQPVVNTYYGTGQVNADAGSNCFFDWSSDVDSSPAELGQNPRLAGRSANCSCVTMNAQITAKTYGELYIYNSITTQFLPHTDTYESWIFSTDAASLFSAFLPLTTTTTTTTPVSTSVVAAMTTVSGTGQAAGSAPTGIATSSGVRATAAPLSIATSSGVRTTAAPSSTGAPITMSLTTTSVGVPSIASQSVAPTVTSAAIYTGRAPAAAPRWASKQALMASVCLCSVLFIFSVW